MNSTLKFYVFSTAGLGLAGCGDESEISASREKNMIPPVARSSCMEDQDRVRHLQMAALTRGEVLSERECESLMQDFIRKNGMDAFRTVTPCVMQL